MQLTGNPGLDAALNERDTLVTDDIEFSYFDVRAGQPCEVGQPTPRRTPARPSPHPGRLRELHSRSRARNAVPAAISPPPLSPITATLVTV